MGVLALDRREHASGTDVKGIPVSVIIGKDDYSMRVSVGVVFEVEALRRLGISANDLAQLARLPPGEATLRLAAYVNGLGKGLQQGDTITFEIGPPQAYAYEGGGGASFQKPQEPAKPADSVAARFSSLEFDK